MIEANGASVSTSTSNLPRSSSTPASAIGSRTRILLGGNRGLERFERARNRGAAFDVGTELDQRQLDGRKRGRDVEHVEPPDVADAEDRALQLSLPGSERHAVPVAQVEQQLVGVDSVRCANGRDDRSRVVVRREQL